MACAPTARRPGLTSAAERCWACRSGRLAGGSGHPGGQHPHRFGPQPLSDCAVELVRIERAARSRGLRLPASTTLTPTIPPLVRHRSREAHWLGCSYVITEVAQGRAAATNSFLLAGATEEEKRFEQETILIDDAIASMES